MHEDEPETITLKNRFLTIATAKVATSAHEGFDLGVYRKGLDEVVMNQGRRIAEAKKSVIEIFDSGYTTARSAKRYKSARSFGTRCFVCRYTWHEDGQLCHRT